MNDIRLYFGTVIALLISMKTQTTYKTNKGENKMDLEKNKLDKYLNDELLRTMGRNLTDFDNEDLYYLYEICKTADSIRDAVSEWQLS
jgi:hypothetical protein